MISAQQMQVMCPFSQFLGIQGSAMPFLSWWLLLLFLSSLHTAFLASVCFELLSSPPPPVMRNMSVLDLHYQVYGNQ